MRSNLIMKKERKQYFLSVDGETEKWYFDYLQELINNNEKAKYVAKIESKISSPTKRFSGIPVPFGVAQAFHICDYESCDEHHIKRFSNTLKEIKEMKKRKSYIKYELGYSNYSFELWIILHKMNYRAPVVDRFKYLKGINKAFGERFVSLEEYKIESNFKRVLSKIDISDVKNAIAFAKEIRKHNEVNCKMVNEFGFVYCTGNPDLTIHLCVDTILKDCGC